MEPPKPTGLGPENPPPVSVPERPALPEPEADPGFLEIKNPVLAAILHYGAISVLGIAAFIMGGLYLGIRVGKGGDIGLLTIIGGGIFGVCVFCKIFPSGK